MKKYGHIFLVLLLSCLLTNCQKENQPPVIQSTNALQKDLAKGQTTELSCKAIDPEGDELTYSWSSSTGSFTNGTNGSSVMWKAPMESGKNTILVSVSDGQNITTNNVTIEIENQSPEIQNITANPQSVIKRDTVQLVCTAIDPDGEELSYLWTSTNGAFSNGSEGSSVLWVAPEESGNYSISVTVSDGQDETSDVVVVEVLTTSKVEGHVYYHGTLLPIKDAMVSINENSTKSDESGFYELENILLGNQTIDALKEGFDNYSEVLNINESNNTFTIEMTSIELTQTVSGKITNEVGKNLAHVIVTLENPDGSKSALSVSTDEESNYQLSYAPQGTRIIIFEKQGYEVVKKELIIANSDYTCNVTLKLSDNFTEFTDFRDGKTYKVVKIGAQIWMAENLAFETSCSWGSYSSEPNYEAMYGRLYCWETALTACPAGWHLPTNNEWKTLSNYLIDNGYGYEGRESDIAKALADKSTWYTYKTNPGDPGFNPEENNSSGFNAKAGGIRDIDWGYTKYIGNEGRWWSSTKFENDSYGRERVSGTVIEYDNANIWEGSFTTDRGFNVRCVMD